MKPSDRVCSQCNGSCTELTRSKDDNIDGLEHAHIKCDKCGYEFNYWYETSDVLKKLFGSNLHLYDN